MDKWAASWANWLRQREHEREMERLRMAQPRFGPGVRERVARAIHDGFTAQYQYELEEIKPHTFDDCHWQDQYLTDADAVLKELGIQPHDQC